MGLLSSIAKSFPIGAVMLLETGNKDVQFKTRPVESVETGIGFREPDELILDGQQRITSLYQTIVSNKVVKTKNEKGQDIFRWYYIDILKAIDPNADIEDSIISINEQKQITKDFGREIVLDLSKPEFEYQNLMYPVCMVDEYDDWREKYEEYWDYNREKIVLFKKFKTEIISNFNNYYLPVITLKKENSREAVCQVFEKVNTGGVSLNVFELLTAIYAIDSFDLRKSWEKVKEKFSKLRVLKYSENTDFLQAITLLSTYNKRINLEKDNISEDRLPAVSAKKKDILKLTLQEYKNYYQHVEEGFIKAAKLLIENYIFKADDLPYVSQLVPLSVILATIGNDIENITVKNKIMQWYWCGVLGELYGGANETRYALDLTQVISWIRNESDETNVKTIYESSFNPSRLNTLRTRNSAAYKGIYNLIINSGAKDFLSGTRIDLSVYFTEAIDIHHIFPRNWCEKQNIPSKDYDCIINKTPLSSRTNKIIGGIAPSKYLENIEKRLDSNRTGIEELISSHKINVDKIYSDDFYGFFEERKKELVKLISDAMCKKIDMNINIIEPESSENNEIDTQEYYEDQI
ncbi:MAG: DUF262 domain-containing protein [Candidatus Kapabacteria bacterium]|nr:DUF262 domain-containing protein [Candidatus Kapabacteria bacterium]